MKKNILCYSDFSENAQNAIDYTINLYKQQECVFYILNAFQAGADASDINALIPEPGNDIYKSAKKTSEAGLKLIIDKLKARSKNPKHSYIAISNYNSLLYALNDTVNTKAIDLLVIGTNDRLDTNKNENIPTLDIMEYITACSILAIPGTFKFGKLEEVVLPVDYQESLSETNFSELIDIAKLQQSAITVLHIKKEHQLDDIQLENQMLLEKLLVGLNYSFRVFERMNVNKGINQFIENENCMLITFVEKRSNYIGNELPEPLLKELKTYLSIPVLLLKNNESK